MCVPVTQMKRPEVQMAEDGKNALVESDMAGRW